MTPDTRLTFLTDLRKDRRLSQKEVARCFGLTGTQSAKSVAAWELGKSVPNVRHRARFIGYLWDDLGLRRDAERFEACWETLVECWHWEPLSEHERAELHLPRQEQPTRNASDTPVSSTTNAEGTVVSRDVNVHNGDAVGRDKYVFQFSRLYQQEDATIDPTRLADAITEYLEWLEDSTHTIELRGIAARGNVVSLPLAEIFVPLRAEVADQRRRAEDRRIALDQVLTVGAQLAVIGGPGSGKSTVLQYIAWVLSKAWLENDGAWATQKLGLRLAAADVPLPLPIYLPLSAYARLRFRGSDVGAVTTFPTFIQHYLQQNHCNIGGLPPEFFRNLLERGHRVILLLDGLDEVANEAERAIVTQTIEHLVAGRGRKQKLSVVVTCRSVAYKGQVILTQGFRQVTVQTLDSKHVERLVRQAYSAVYELNPEEREARTKELLDGITRLEAEQARRQSASVDNEDLAFADDDEEASQPYQLINSPLMVRMLLVVHLNDRKLPQHRADLYRRFVETILESIHVADRTVAQELSGLRGNNLALMSHLAFAMHSQGQAQGREIELDTLQRLLGADFADEAADFVTLIHSRGTLVEERDGYYRFIHLAFQEYLTARYLAEVYWRDEGIKGTIRFLAAQTPDSWWREVATLLPGYLREALPPHAKRVLYALAGGHDGSTNWQPEAAQWPPDVQLAAAEIAATASLEWFE
jgi:transcriptional regulator with XRE-family HTH domain